MTALLLLVALTSPARAAEPEPTAVFSAARARVDEPTPAAQAIALALGATFFAEVKISTAGPVVELSRLNHQGFYKRELIQLLLLSAKARKPFHQVVEARRNKGKAKPLRELAAGWGVDYDALYEASLALEESVDRHYLPRFPERRRPKERDEP